MKHSLFIQFVKPRFPRLEHKNIPPDVVSLVRTAASGTSRINAVNIVSPESQWMHNGSLISFTGIMFNWSPLGFKLFTEAIHDRLSSSKTLPKAKHFSMFNVRTSEITMHIIEKHVVFFV